LLHLLGGQVIARIFHEISGLGLPFKRITFQIKVGIVGCPGVLEYWSVGALQNIKFQALNLRFLGVGCQGSGVIQLPGFRCRVSGVRKKKNKAVT